MSQYSLFKQCKKCKQTKPIKNNFHICKGKNGKEWIRGVCRQCDNERKKQERLQKPFQTFINRTNGRYAKYGLRKPCPNDLMETWERQNGICYYCNKKIELNNKNTHIDHKIPVSRGGTNEKENLVFACINCNDEKGKLTEEEFWNKRGGRLPF